MNKLTLLSMIVCSTGFAATAFANVKGLTSDQLARLANQTAVPTQQQHQLSNNQGSITLSQADQANILHQLAQIKANEDNNSTYSGFSTISYKPRASRINSNNAQIVEQETQPDESKRVATVKNDEPPESNWMMNLQLKNYQNIKTAQNQISEPQNPKSTEQQQATKRNIAVGHFYSPQAQQANYQVVNPISTGNFNVRRSSSSAPTIGNSQFYARGPATIECVIEAAHKHNVPPHVLLGIASKEYGRNGQTVKNTDRSYDMGHFQLNTIHFQRGEAFNHINIEDAKWRGCYNAELAAWHLNRQLTRKGKEDVDFWTRAGGYHSWTPGPNRIYVNGTAKNKGLKQYAQEWQTWLSKNTQYQAKN